jgi:uncharacterized membrane protein (DUF485 family)
VQETQTLLNLVPYSGLSLVTGLTPLWLQTEVDPRPDLTLNYIIIGVLLVIAAVLSVIVVKRRLRERDDEWDA